MAIGTRKPIQRTSRNRELETLWWSRHRPAILVRGRNANVRRLMLQRTYKTTYQTYKTTTTPTTTLTPHIFKIFTWRTQTPLVHERVVPRSDDMEALPIDIQSLIWRTFYTNHVMEEFAEVPFAWVRITQSGDSFEERGFCALLCPVLAHRQR